MNLHASNIAHTINFNIIVYCIAFHPTTEHFLIKIQLVVLEHL